MANRLLQRADWRSYMQCGDTPAYELIGPGFTSFTESKNPKEYSRQYVHEKTERTDVTGYAPSIEYSADIYSEDPVALEIMKVTDGELVGTDAQRKIVSVNLFEAGKTPGSYAAYERTYAIIPDGKGDGFDALVYTGAFRAVGDAIKGQFNEETKTFTADGAAEQA